MSVCLTENSLINFKISITRRITEIKLKLNHKITKEK